MFLSEYALEQCIFNKIIPILNIISILCCAKMGLRIDAFQNLIISAADFRSL